MLPSWQVFYNGLGALIGEPTDEEVGKKTILDAIREEHTSLIHPDVTEKFRPGNYGITTTPQIEYAFVDDECKDPFVVELRRKMTNNWPKEDEEKLRQQKEENKDARPREMQLLSSFRAKRQEYADLLTLVDTPRLTDAEFIAGRLYTGPMRVPTRGSNSVPLPCSFGP